MNTLTHRIISEKQLPESELEIAAEVAYETLLPHRAAVLLHMNEHTNIPGFRAGHVPEHILVSKAGELNILQEAAYGAIEAVLPGLFHGKNTRVVGEPRVVITKLAAGNPLGFTITVSVMPEVKLPNYKKIAATENAKPLENTEVSEEEVSELVENIRKMFAAETAKTGETGSTEKTPLPELTDELVKKLGDFKNVADFREKMKENLVTEKKRKTREKKRISIAELVLKKTETSVPKALTETELAKLLARVHDDAARLGLKQQEYLKHIKKTEDDLRTEWRPEAEKRGKLQLVLSAIAEAEHIDAPKDTVEEELKHFLEHYKDADPARARRYLETVITNEKVFEFLENQK